MSLRAVEEALAEIEDRCVIEPSHCTNADCIGARKALSLLRQRCDGWDDDVEDCVLDDCGCTDGWVHLSDLMDEMVRLVRWWQPRMVRDKPFPGTKRPQFDIAEDLKLIDDTERLLERWGEYSANPT